MAKHPKPVPVPHGKGNTTAPITEQERCRRMKAVRGVDAISAIEGAPISDYARQLSSRWANGEITHGEMVEALVKRHTRLGERTISR